MSPPVPHRDHPIRTVLFDLDGTLLDSIELILGGYRAMMMEHHGEVPPDTVWLHGIGTPLRDQIAALAKDAVQAEAMFHTYVDYNVTNHDALAGPYAGVGPLVRDLHAAGAALGIVTSKRMVGAERGLRRMGLDDVFPAVVAVDTVTNAKPHPEPVLRALDILGADPATAVFVGDSTHDLASGRAAGVRTAAALWGPYPREALEQHAPTFWFDSPEHCRTALLGALA